MSISTIRSALTVAFAIGLALAAGACGGSSDSAPAASGEGGASGGTDIAGVASCLTNRGFEVVREADQDEALVLPDEYKQSVGLIESVSLGSIGSVKGTGSVAFFTDSDGAEEDFEAASAFQTDDVLSGTTGATSWNYIVTAGEDPGVKQMLSACLSS